MSLHICNQGPFKRRKKILLTGRRKLTAVVFLLAKARTCLQTQPPFLSSRPARFQLMTVYNDISTRSDNHDSPNP